MNRLQDFGEELIIVIDPGHGGENEGTIENGHLEKSMNLITAQSMYDTLTQFDHVTVYMTHTDDITMSIKERAKFAASKNADFLISLHYNASACHELYGAEVWVPLEPSYNTYGYQFGSIVLEQLSEMGLFNRGIKTKLSSDGVSNYYGILRESAAQEIPAVIVEHCHVDEAHDEGYCDTTEELVQFGYEDAIAVAKYFGLKSTSLNLDYTDYQLVSVTPDTPVAITLQDDSAPEFCQLDFISADYDNCLLTLQVSAMDAESPLTYYSYSLDGGETFSTRFIWPDSDTLAGTYTDTFTLNLTIPEGSFPKVMVKAYNMYELTTDSNLYISQKVFQYKDAYTDTVATPTQTPIAVESNITMATSIPEVTEAVSQNKSNTILTFVLLSLCIALLIFITFVISRILYYSDRKRRRARKQSEQQSIHKKG